MRSTQIIGSALALASYVLGQDAPQTKQVCDSSKFCSTVYSDAESGMTFGIALPTNVTDPYDAVISITVPVANGWVGFAWGGTMVWNPLTVIWPNGNTVVPSSRWAYNGLPATYDGAEYHLLKGTTVNSTHYTLKALCKGCTGWIDNSEERYVLNGTGNAEFAWASSPSAVQDPTKNDTAFNMHTAYGKWVHDLNSARNANFDSWVNSNLLTPNAAPSSAIVSSIPTSAATSAATSVQPSHTNTSPLQNAAIPSSCSGAGSPVFSSVLASGWKATKVAGGLTNPRSIQFDSAGNMLVVQAGKGISYHAVGSDGCITSTKMLVSLNSLNHGIALSPDGKTLYASSMTQAFSWPYDAAAASVGTRTTIITGMVNGGSHQTRTLAISASAPNLLVVSHGSNANIDTGASDPKTARAIIKVFDLSAIPSGGYNYPSSGWNAGYGLRNEVGITFDNNNMLWGVENSGDDFTRTVNGQSKDIHQNNPAEKLHYIGDITKPNDQWYGYPTCFSVWNPPDFTDKTFKVGDWFVQAPNSSFTDETCNTKAVLPKLVLFPHSAPIDCKFNADNTNMYITYHGSWDRQPTTGFKLVQVAFTKGADGQYAPTAPITSTTGAVDIFWNPDVTKCAGNGPSFSSGCFRPAGLSFDKAGRLYMTSDTSAGELWVLGKA